MPWPWAEAAVRVLAAAAKLAAVPTAAAIHTARANSIIEKEAVYLLLTFPQESRCTYQEQHIKELRSRGATVK